MIACGANVVERVWREAEGNMNIAKAATSFESTFPSACKRYIVFVNTNVDELLKP
jgi:hypothetical protein